MSILLVEKNGQKTEAAVILHDQLYAFQGAVDANLQEGQIFRGTVDRVLKGVNAVFIRLPGREMGFLPFSPGKKAPASGTAVLVQVKRPPNLNKKAMLSQDIALGGDHVVYLPNGGGVHVSSRIQDAGEKQTLISRGKAFLPATGGLILRSAAMNADDSRLADEIATLIFRWKEIAEKAAEGSTPSLLWNGADPIEKLLNEEKHRLECVIANTPATLPSSISCPIKFSEHPFILYNVRHRLEKSMRRTVQMKSGATLVIDPCEAMTVIDVNSAMASVGKDIAQTAEKINTEAAREIARLLRLRGIGGMIVIDFIDMASAEAQERLLNTMREALLEDPVKTTVHDITSLGLMEITRQRKQLPLPTLPDVPCPHCGGTGILFSDHEEDAANA